MNLPPPRAVVGAHIKTVICHLSFQCVFVSEPYHPITCFYPDWRTVPLIPFHPNPSALEALGFRARSLRVQTAKNSTKNKRKFNKNNR